LLSDLGPDELVDRLATLATTYAAAGRAGNP
jgi:hypothetical protein